MKRFFWYLLIQLAGIISFAQDYTPTDKGSAIKFRLKNFGINTEGSFSGLEGRIRFVPAHPENDSFDVSINSASVNTDSDIRDEHLKTAAYFDVVNHPRIRFVSTKVTAGPKEGSYNLSGKLTIKNTTKDISFPFIATPLGNDYIFSGEFNINRKDFEIGGSSTISNNVTVSLTVLGRKV